MADNLAKHEITESESLLFGTGFGVVTDIQTGPNGNLFVVSLTDGAVYEISRAPKGKMPNPRLASGRANVAAAPELGQHFAAHLTGARRSRRETRGHRARPSSA